MEFAMTWSFLLLVQGKSGELYPANLQVANASGQSNASGFDLVVLGCHLVLKALVLTNPPNGGENVTPIRCPSCKADFATGEHRIRVCRRNDQRVVA